MSEENRNLVHRWFKEVWNEGREGAIDEMFGRDSVAHGLGDSEQDVRGPAEFKAFAGGIRSAIPDLHISVDDLFSAGDRVAVRITLVGTHTGNGLGVPPTGNKVRVQGVIIVRIAGGQILEGWNSYDQLGLLRQIGALPALGGADTFLAAR